MHEADEEEFESYESSSTLVEVVDDRKPEVEKDKDLDHEGLTRITEKAIKEVQQKLGLIKLCWPEVDLRKDLYLKSLPSRYCSLSDKEKVLAWYAENFRQQFCAKHPDRKPLLLVCENECGVQKFVSTIIRRSTLPYPELYTWQGCGKFVSDYIEYEPLEKPLNMPKHIRSPTWVQKFQKGNSFECATFLASLLLGQGYNAFVVSGYARREQTLCDLTRIPCPYLRKPKPPPPPPAEPEITKYKLKPPTEYTSQFLEELEREQERKVQEKLRRQEEEERRLIEELEQLPTDKYWGHRIHAWVAILPELRGLRDQEFSGPLFIEPSTGVSYKPTDDNADQLYLGVESIWNDLNYWVNMQPSSQSCANIKWDLTKVELWEHLLPGEPWVMRGEEIDEDSAIMQEEHLDMPASYVNEIHIDEKEFERRYPNGMKTKSYKKAIVELYAPYLHTDGLIRRIIIYNDYDYKAPIELYEYYANRSDCLVEHRKKFKDDSVIDYYQRGRPDRCKEHRYFSYDISTIETERILDFYHIARYDGLSRIELHPSFLTQHFVDREDFLYYRHVEFSRERSAIMPHDVHFRYIWKITEKFNRNEAIKANRDIAIREFAIGENEIRLTYHYKPGLYTRATRTYIKPPLAERGDRLALNPTMTKGYNPLGEPDKGLELLNELDRQLKEEDESTSRVREAEEEVTTFLKTKDEECLTPKLLISIYDTLRESESRIELLKIERTREQSQRDITEIVDYLKPHLARIGNPSEVSKSYAYVLRHECIEDYKQLLIQRANKILHKFDELSQELAKKQTQLTQTEDLSREEEDKILEEMNEINFHLQTLETRLNRHRDLVPIRFNALVDNLNQHPQLLAIRDSFERRE
ncbi:dynein regulatory complex subunit 7-like [Calliopsis andreniformis]|uniref:dynein regulatory complex subunit 7-like n=1 Tax=Calliopsis andreniformis TaxID=337506 RepID=UPI003FCEDFAE